MVDQGRPPQSLSPPRPRLTGRQIAAQMIIGGLILLSGVAIGTGGTVLILKDRIIWRLPPRGGRGRPDPNRIVDDWTAKYELEQAQAEKIRQIFAKRFEAHRTQFAEMVKRVQAERKAFAAAIEQVLTPEQYRQWERDFNERAERYRRMWPGPPGRRPRGPGDGGPPDGSPRFGRRDRRPRGREADEGRPAPADAPPPPPAP